MGGDWGDAQGPGGVPPPGSATDHRDDDGMRGRRRVVVNLGSGGNGRHKAPNHWGVHQEAAGDYIRKGDLPPNL